jgi:predicted enzyme related to lactoylglutathione lyase
MSSTGGFSLSRIGQIYITAHDLDRAAAFYKDTLGIKELFRVPKMAFFDCGGIRLMLGVPEKPEFDHPSSIIYFQVEDVEAAHRALAGRGVKFETEPHFVARLEKADLWIGFFRDSEGNLMAVQSERART